MKKYSEFGHRSRGILGKRYCVSGWLTCEHLVSKNHINEMDIVLCHTHSYRACIARSKIAGTGLIGIKEVWLPPPHRNILRPTEYSAPIHVPDDLQAVFGGGNGLAADSGE